MDRPAVAVTRRHRHVDDVDRVDGVGRPGARRRRLGVAIAVLAGFVPSACDGDTAAEPPTSTEAPRPDADAYGVALATVLDGPPPAEGTDRTVVFVVPLDEGVDIDTQASVIDRFAESYDVRFVDELAAAVQEEEPHAPRDDGLVVGLGSITTEPPYRVRLEQYRSSDVVQATRVTLDFDDGWLVATTDPVPAEVLVDAL